MESKYAIPFAFIKYHSRYGSVDHAFEKVAWSKKINSGVPIIYYRPNENSLEQAAPAKNGASQRRFTSSFFRHRIIRKSVHDPFKDWVKDAG
jgi:hypothetical protein